MREVVIVSAVRTAIGTFGGALKDIGAISLGSLVIKEVLKRGQVHPESVNDVYLGQVLQGGLGQNPARQASVGAGIPYAVPATTINQVCGSGMKAIQLGSMAIATGHAEIVVAGGMENMSQAPYLLPNNRWGMRMGDGKVVDTMIKDGLFCAFHDLHMGLTAEELSEIYSITREEQDAYAAMSQNRTEMAQEQGFFEEEILPLEIPQRKKEPLLFAKDEHPRPNVTKEDLARLGPVFKKDGTVTPGNASGLNDGAAVLLLTSKEKAKTLSLPVLSKIQDFSCIGLEPLQMGMGPLYATRAILKRQDLTLEDIDLIEANEAFAAQSLALAKEFQWDQKKVNVNGGAIALGHPIGASGARILVTLLYAMKRRGAQRGLATLCVGGGQGLATLVES